MKLAKLLGGALVAGVLVAVLPEILGPGPIADFGVGDKLATGALLVPLGLIFLGGVLTALTPCVYPLIPITISVFGARQASSRGKAIALTSCYCLGIATMFTSMGIAAALSGKAFGSALGSPYIVAFLAILLTTFAFSMFGAFEMNLPPSVAARLNTVGGAGYGGAFAMGLVAGIVAAPCTGPVLSGVLLHVARTQDVKLGAMLLFTYSLGIGLPFFLIGALSMSLPRGGAWMESVKSVFGIALLTLALMYIRDAVPSVRTHLTLEELPRGAFVCGALVAAGILIGAVHRSFHDWPKDGLLKGLGVAVMVAGLILRSGAVLGTPLPKELAWARSEPSVVAAAVGAKRPVIIDFYADWCAACKELDRIVYPHESFRREAGRFDLVKIDGTNEPPEIEALYKKYGVQGLPTVVFIGSDGKIRRDLTLTGFLEPEKFVARMKQVE